MMHFTVNRSTLGRAWTPHFFVSIKVPKGKVLHQVATIRKESVNPSLKPDELFAHVSVPSIDQEKGCLDKIEYLHGSEIKGTRSRFNKGDILYARIEPSIYNGKCAIVPDDIQEGVCSNELYVVIPDNNLILTEYLFYLLRSNLVLNQVFGRVTGSTGRGRLDVESFKEIILPVPDIREQKKIVGRLIELWTKVDELERKIQKLTNEVCNKIDSNIWKSAKTVVRKTSSK